MFTEQTLNLSLAGIGLAADPALFVALRSAYSERHRHYHTAEHISDCLGHMGRVRELAQRPAEIEIAIWFHDAVYDTHLSDNEEKSAAWAADYLSKQGAPPDVTQRITQMIIATKAHLYAGGDTAFLLDVDLSILGATPDVFEAYDEAIRTEYSWVPDDKYRRARSVVLKQFLDAPQIYSTETFRRLFERDARRNLCRKIASLE